MVGEMGTGETGSGETQTTWVLHVDLDQFLAAVEVRRRPELAGLPVVVGGDGNPTAATPGGRDRVVRGASVRDPLGDAARAGVAALSRRRLPAVGSTGVRRGVGGGDGDAAHISRDGRGVGMGRGVPRCDDATIRRRFAYEVKARVAATTGLSCAVGIGDTRLLAKTATGFAKPGGVARLTRREWIPTMGAKPVTAIWGIGTRTAARLGELGIVTVEDLARADHHELARSFGPTIGPHLRVLGLGGDDSPIVDEPHVARGRSKEETFTTDVADPAAIADHVDRLAREVTADVVADGRRVTHVAVKVRTATLLHPHQDQQAAGSDDRPGRGRSDGVDGARPLRRAPSRTPTRCASRPRDAGLNDDRPSSP